MKYYIFDFDGTIQRVFSGTDFSPVLLELKNVLDSYHIIYEDFSDPFMAMHIADQMEGYPFRDIIELKIEEILTKMEISSVHTGKIIEGFFDFISFAREKGIFVGIVTNNSKECVLEFLRLYLGDAKVPVFGRIPLEHDKLKPSPYMLKAMCEAYKLRREDIVFIGDHPRDYECARAFGSSFMGMTPTESKYRRMKEYAPDIVLFHNFHELIEYIKK